MKTFFIEKRLTDGYWYRFAGPFDTINRAAGYCTQLCGWENFRVAEYIHMCVSRDRPEPTIVMATIVAPEHDQ
jgi:hypothetical protein